MTTERTTPPAAPAGLQLAGRKLWCSVTGEWQLRADERALLELACRTLDEITTLQDALAEGQPVTKGSRGQMQPNRLYSEIRSHRLALARVLRQLGIPEETGERLSRSEIGRRGAHARWRGSVS